MDETPHRDPNPALRNELALESYKQGSEACRNYSGLTMRVRITAMILATAGIAIPFSKDINTESQWLVVWSGGIVLFIAALGLALIDWHYQSAFAAIRNALAQKETLHNLPSDAAESGTWRAHLQVRTHLFDHVASYLPFVFLGLIGWVGIRISGSQLPDNFRQLETPVFWFATTLGILVAAWFVVKALCAFIHDRRLKEDLMISDRPQRLRDIGQLFWRNASSKR